MISRPFWDISTSLYFKPGGVTQIKLLRDAVVFEYGYKHQRFDIYLSTPEEQLYGVLTF